RSSLVVVIFSIFVICYTIMISDQATTIHVDSQETKNKVKLGLVDWFVDQPFSSKSFSSFNPLEKGFSRYHVRLIPTVSLSRLNHGK
ncbi:unnamed protein product, partial [Brassica oleracea]